LCATGSVSARVGLSCHRLLILPPESYPSQAPTLPME
jgi:hypothetical protein